MVRSTKSLLEFANYYLNDKNKGLLDRGHKMKSKWSKRIAKRDARWLKAMRQPKIVSPFTTRSVYEHLIDNMSRHFAPRCNRRVQFFVKRCVINGEMRRITPKDKRKKAGVYVFNED